VFLIRWEAHPFFAVTKSVKSDVLVVEGWIPTEVVEQAAAEFTRGNYRTVVVVRATYDFEEGLFPPTSENRVAAKLVRCGIQRDRIVPLVYTGIRKDRTYHSALTVKEWFVKNGGIPSSFNLVTLGPHARRSWVLFAKAFGDTANIGIVALEDYTYDSSHWWRTSEGVREVIGETIAYVYARFFFGWTQEPLLNL
jgi:hypothetical protein